MPLNKLSKIFLVTIGVVAGIFSIDLKGLASPCLPTDPEGVNPDNLCNPFPPYSPGMPVVSGTGLPANWSPYGQYPRNQNNGYTTKGYWTGTQVNGDTRTLTIQDSNGQSHSFQPSMR